MVDEWLASACREMARRSPPSAPPVRIRKWHQGGGGSLAGELRQELFALTGAETADAALRRDPGALHDRSGAGLADARQCTDNLVDLRLAGEVIIAAQHTGEREGARFHAGQQGRPGGARLARLRQRFLALLGDRTGSAMEGFLSMSRAGTAASGMSCPSWRVPATTRAAAGPASRAGACFRGSERSTSRELSAVCTGSGFPRACRSRRGAQSGMMRDRDPASRPDAALS